VTEHPGDPVPEQPDPAHEDVDAAAGTDEPHDGVPPWLREPVDHSFEAPGQPEREMRPARRPRRRRRAERPGTNPSVDDVPDVAPPRDPGTADETEHDRWLRAQRPPHWE
jgi:hypothetical protein